MESVTVTNRLRTDFSQNIQIAIIILFKLQSEISNWKLSLVALQPSKLFIHKYIDTLWLNKLIHRASEFLLFSLKKNFSFLRKNRIAHLYFLIKFWEQKFFEPIIFDSIVTTYNEF